MELSGIPSFSFPSTVLLVDDNARFLKHISLQLSMPINPRLFSDAEEALSYLAFIKNPPAGQQSTPYIVTDVESSTCVGNYYSMNCDISAIHKMIYNPNRFETVSVVVIDYAMPKMNGLDFCLRLQNLQDTPIKKIMLTGEADHQVAVAAFNEGLIDQFILKSTPNLNQKLNDSILSMHQKYFVDLTKNISQSLLSEPMYCLRDPKVAEQFRSHCEQNGILEYYLLDSAGTFLCLDLLGHPSWFVVRSSAELKMHADFAEEDGLSKTLCNALRTGQKISFFPSMLIESGQWNSYLYPALPIKGETESYYYAFLKDIDIIKQTTLCMEDILCYGGYKKHAAKPEEAAVA